MQISKANATVDCTRRYYHAKLEKCRTVEESTRIISWIPTILKDYDITNQFNPDVVRNLVTLGLVPSFEYMYRICCFGKVDVLKVLLDLESFNMDKKYIGEISTHSEIAKVLHQWKYLDDRTLKVLNDLRKYRNENK